MRHLLLLSNSRDADGRFLQHCRDALAAHLAGVRSALLVPWAGVTVTAEAYTARVRAVVEPFGIALRSVHEATEPADAVREAEAIIVGGGNTFRLLERMQQHGVLGVMRDRVLAGVPYVGWSAGSVVACPTIGTTNDMPIVAPAGFAALGLVGFQINAHFTDAHPAGFRGETRRERLAEYVTLNPTARVAGLPEGSWLTVQGEAVRLDGPHEAPCFSAAGVTMLAAGRDVRMVVEPDG